MSSPFLPVFSTSCLFVGLAVLLHAPAWSQSTNSSITGHQAPVSSKLAETGPTWAELTPSQQNSLRPLQNLWPELEEHRKRKWLAIAKTFPSLNTPSQVIAQERMREWAALSPLQRSQARLNFAHIQQLSPDEKLAKWEAYQSLNDDEKQSLLKRKQELSHGAATSPKPISPDKLTVTPAPKAGQVKIPKIETATLHPLTLLRIKKAKHVEPVDKP